MRILAVRNKARDFRLVGMALVGLCALTVSGWDASPLPDTAMLVSGVFLVGMASILRVWSVLYIAGFKTERLIMEGPFSICRNPIYLGTFLGLFGIALATGTLLLPLLVLVVFLPYIHFQVRGEEQKLLEKHGARFTAYCQRTPRLIPNFRLLDEPLEYTVRPAKFRTWIADGLWFIWGLGIVELIEALHEMHVLPVLWRIY